MNVKKNVSPGDYKLLYVRFNEGAWYFNTSYLVRVFIETSLMFLNFYLFEIFSA
jgi:hypothetical protein